MAPAAAGAAGEPYLSPGERQELLREVETCDADTEEARRSDSQKDRQQLLVCLERGLHLRRRLYAESSAEVVGACRHLCEALNFAATRMLQSDNLKGACDLLKRAEQVADKSELDRAITWNNLACYYRRVGKLRTAVTFLERALAIEEHTGSADSAQTHLNLCATLSQLQRHSEAVYHAQSALIRIYEMLSPHMLSGDMASLGTGARGDSSPTEGLEEQVTVLCIAYHNLAVEHEYLKKPESALCAYASGLRWASRFLDRSHQLHGILRDSAEAVKGKLPKGSAALRRAEELSAGWPEKVSSAGGGESAGSAHNMGNLMTPRGQREEATADADEESVEEDPEEF